MDSPLANKVAIVTGTSSPTGIGRATALELARHGASLIITDLAVEGADGSVGTNAAPMRELASEIRALGGTCAVFDVDVTDRLAINRCVEQVVNEHGGVDILVNNAGSTVGALPFLDIESTHWDLSFRINLKGTAEFCQAVIPSMLSRGGGSIINNASTAGLGAEAGFGAYNATKHAVVGLTKTIAAEFGPNGITCNAVCPGYIATDMHTEATKRLATEAGVSVEEMARRRYEGVAARRAGTPAEVAALIAFLAGPGARYINGSAIPISGGTPVGL